ncbi:MAG: hypothetical protein IPG47_08795 [Thermoflexaceae bacterium]|nr:hypothetical protein [Thermoflexaceae bacterium]
MLFGFRSIRRYQVMLAIIAIVFGVTSALTTKSYTEEKEPVLLGLTALFMVLFIWMFSLALRAPTSFVAVSDERTRIRFAGFVDTVIDNRSVIGVRLVKHPLWGGIGVRTSFGGTVALATATGQVAELVLRQPVRVWLIPRILPVRANNLRLSIRNPQKLVERFGAPPAERPQPAASSRKARTRGSRARQ